MIFLIRNHLKQYRLTSLITICFTIAGVISEMQIPYTMGRMIDDGIEKGDLRAVVSNGLLMLFFALFSLGCGYGSAFLGAYSATGFAANLRESMFAKIQDFSFANIDRFSGAGLVTRLTSDVSNLQNAYQMLIRLSMRAPGMLITAFLMAFFISRRLSLIFLEVILFLGIAIALIIRAAGKLFTAAFRQYDGLNGSIQENVRGIRVVKSFVREKFESEKFQKKAEELYRVFVNAEIHVVKAMPLMMLASYFSIIALSWFGGRMVVFGELSTGELASLFTYGMDILISLMILSFVFVMISMSEASASRMREIFEEESDIQSPKNPIREVADGSVVFDRVCFSYKKGSSKYVLSDVTFRIESGETVGIIGGTGSAKTTLVSLISRLYDVSAGQIFVGGEDVRRYDLKTLRDQVGIVLQKNEVFSGTILENLRWGNEKATLEECREAVRIACADEFIETMPKGYDTRIEQGGSNLSGGQKQRLCIARALLKKPRILIFDDSTSAVDMETDARIRRGLERELPGTTKIIIAQRISSVKEADRILVLDEGRLMAFDGHEALLRTNEIYESIARGQQETGDFDRKEATA